MPLVTLPACLSVALPARAHASTRGCLCPQDTDFDPVIEEINIDETTEFEAPIEVAIYYISEVMKSDVVSTRGADGAEMPFADAFTDVDMQAGFLVSSNDSFFKKAAYKRFPGGQFSCVAASTRDQGRREPQSLGPAMALPSLHDRRPDQVLHIFWMCCEGAGARH